MSGIKRKSLRRVDNGDVVVADGVEADYLQLVVYALHLHVLEPVGLFLEHVLLGNFNQYMFSRQIEVLLSDDDEVNREAVELGLGAPGPLLWEPGELDGAFSAYYQQLFSLVRKNLHEVTLLILHIK